MRLSVATELGDVKCMQVDKDIDIAGLKALISADFGVPPPEQQILFNGAPLNQEKTLAQNGVGNDDILLLRRNAPAAATAGGATGQAEMVRLQILNNPALRQQITSQNPLLAQALSNPEQFGRIFQEMQRHLQSNPNQMSHDSSDPMDVQAQQRIEEEIKQRNIAMNMESAMEHHPESFGRVIMLYVNTEVNGHKVKAFVDSGAQATIMSPDCAQKCNIMHLLDKRFAGEARGVGVAKILGRVHSAQIKVGNQFLHCSFTVMEGKDVDLLFGLDMLKRHQCTINLALNVLSINDENIPFLSEHELPDNMRHEQPSEAIASQAEPSNIEKKTENAKYEESVIKGLIDLGFSRTEAISALDATEGNAEMAANLLFQ